MKRLPVALVVVLLAGGFVWRSWRAFHEVSKLSPPLDINQMHALPTYGRKCHKHADCGAPLLCLHDPRSAGWRCLASECQTDFQCQPGFTCVPFNAPGATSIGLCFIQGTRGEGERCLKSPLRAAWGCRPGLICNSGFCGRACGPEGSPVCPEGSACQETFDGPVCLPSCRPEACPPEKRCVQFGEKLSVCATVKGQDCDRQPCGGGQECRRTLGTRWQEQIVNMWCALPCDEKDAGSRTCPPGFTCFLDYCERLCNEDEPGACGPGEQCTRVLNPERLVTICRLSP